MQAIRTKFLPPTDRRGSRVKAECQAGSIILNWDHAHNPDANHGLACMALVAKLGWTPDKGRGYQGMWVMGELPDQSSAHVFVPAEG